MLKHPSIVSLKNFILKKGKPHLVQEYVDGQTLDEYIHNVTGPIPTQRAIEIIKDVLTNNYHGMKFSDDDMYQVH